MLQCQDSFFTTFNSFNEMMDYHVEQSRNSVWKQVPIHTLHVKPIGLGDASFFASDVTSEAIEDTKKHLGLAILINLVYYPVRDTAFNGLLDRANIKGEVLSKVSKLHLSQILNICMQVNRFDSLVLIRNQKVTAIRSREYSILPIESLLDELQNYLNTHFFENKFLQGYSDHQITTASWLLLNQDNLLRTYKNKLSTVGKSNLADNLLPVIRFQTSDTGISSVKIAAMLKNGSYSIPIGDCISVEHRNNSKIEDFSASLYQLFAQYRNQLDKLQRLLDIQLEYPVNAMVRICKKSCLPKKAAVEAIAMFEMSYGGGVATAHDVFMALQEIPFLLKSQNIPERKLFEIEEKIARTMMLNWDKYDLARAVNY